MNYLQSVLSFALPFCFFSLSAALPARAAGLKKDIAALSGGRAEPFDWHWIESHAAPPSISSRSKGLNEKAASAGQTNFETKAAPRSYSGEGEAGRAQGAAADACHSIFSTDSPDSPPRQAAIALPSVFHKISDAFTRNVRLDLIRG